MEYETLIFERFGQVGRLSLNRPDKLNSLTRQMFAELSHFWLARQDDIECRVIILTGVGRAFCAGADVAEMEEAPAASSEGLIEELVRRESLIHDMVLMMRHIPQPLIAAVHGWAAGGGFSLAMAADIRIVDSTAKFIASFINVGLSGGDMGSSAHLPGQIGLALARELLMTGEVLPAQRAKDIGLCNHLTPEGGHLEKAQEIADRIARRPLSYLAGIKRAISI